MKRTKKCMGIDGVYTIISMGDSVDIKDLTNADLMVNLDNEGVPYVLYNNSGSLWGIDLQPHLQEIVQNIYADYMRVFFPQAYAAQARLDAGHEFTPPTAVWTAKRSGAGSVGGWYENETSV